jgi:hypothetical protein
MKTLTFINKGTLSLVLALALTFSSCQKETPESNQQNELNTSLAAMQNTETQRVAYETMSASERLSLWQNHLAWAKSNLTLTTAQLEKIIELDAMLNTEFFSSTNSSDAFEIWKATASEVFSLKQLFLLFQQPFQFKADKFNSSDPLSGYLHAGDKTPGCSCNSEQANHCMLYPTDQIGWFECRGGSCKSSQTGCGWLWKSTCNGRCEYVSPFIS